MFQSYLNKNLQEGEEVLRVVRRSVGSFAPGAIVGALCIFAPFFFLFPLFRLGWIGAALFFLLFLFGLFLVGRAVFRSLFTALCITNRRMIDIDQRGMFDRVVSEIAYTAVQDVSVSVKGVRQTLFRLGTVHIGTSGEGANFEFRDIRDAEQVRELIVSQAAGVDKRLNV